MTNIGRAIIRKHLIACGFDEAQDGTEGFVVSRVCDGKVKVRWHSRLVGHTAPAIRAFYCGQMYAELRQIGAAAHFDGNELVVTDSRTPAAGPADTEGCGDGD